MELFTKRYYAGESQSPPASTNNDYFAVFNNNKVHLRSLGPLSARPRRCQAFRSAH